MNTSVLVVGGITVGATALSRIAQTGQAKSASISRILLGGILYVGFLSLLDGVNHAIAMGLGITVLLTSLLLNGVPLFEAISRKVA